MHNRWEGLPWRNHRRDFIGNTESSKLSPDTVLSGFCGCHSFRAGCSRENGAGRRIRAHLFKLHGSIGELGFGLGDGCSLPARVSGVRSMDMVHEYSARPETRDDLYDFVHRCLGCNRVRRGGVAAMENG